MKHWQNAQEHKNQYESVFPFNSFLSVLGSFPSSHFSSNVFKCTPHLLASLKTIWNFFFSYWQIAKISLGKSEVTIGTTFNSLLPKSHLKQCSTVLTVLYNHTDLPTKNFLSRKTKKKKNTQATFYKGQPEVKSPCFHTTEMRLQTPFQVSEQSSETANLSRLATYVLYTVNPPQQKHPPHTTHCFVFTDEHLKPTDCRTFLKHSLKQQPSPIALSKNTSLQCF